MELSDVKLETKFNYLTIYPYFGLVRFRKNIDCAQVSLSER